MRIRRTHGFYPLSVIQKGSYEGFRLRGNNGVTVAAQSSHSGGSPINQRECAGFNWPPATIPAQEPVSISPEASKRAGVFATSQTSLPSKQFIGTFGVGQPTCVFAILVRERENSLCFLYEDSCFRRRPACKLCRRLQIQAPLPLPGTCPCAVASHWRRPPNTIFV